jgi:uridine kinase
VVLIDGLWLLQRPELRPIFSLSLYVDCAEELRLARRLARDQSERGRSRASILRQWRLQARPMHNRHVAPQQRLAHMVVTSEAVGDALTGLVKRIRGIIGA